MCAKTLWFDIDIDDSDISQRRHKPTLVWSGGGGRNFYDRSVFGTLQFVR